MRDNADDSFFTEIHDVAGIEGNFAEEVDGVEYLNGAIRETFE